MAVDSSNAVSQSQIISSTSKTTNTKKSNTLNMENFLSLLVAEMQNQDPLEPTLHHFFSGYGHPNIADL